MELFGIKHIYYNFVMGGTMEELEFSRELVKILDKSILQKVLKRAGSQGFTVQGFDKNVWKAPAMKVNSSLGKRKRGGKYQYQILLESLASLEEDSAEIELARKWLMNGEKRVEAEKKLVEVRDSKQVKEIAESNEIKEVISSVIDEKNNENIDVISQHKKRIEKLKKTLQEHRALADRYKKEIGDLQKEKTKLEKRFKEEQEKNEKLIEDINEFEKRIDGYQKQLYQKDEDINYYKKKFEKLPHVICFCAKKIDIEMFPLYNIEQVREWRNEFVDEIEWKGYQKIWIVESDFNYSEVVEIKKMAKGKVVAARNLKSLMEKVGGDK